MSSLTRPLVTEGAPAVVAATGFAAIAVFQVALAAGAPLGRAAWGGTHPEQLPVGSALAARSPSASGRSPR